MTRRDIIVVGTSAGGVEVLIELMKGLPPGFPAAVFVVCHFLSDFRYSHEVAEVARLPRLPIPARSLRLAGSGRGTPS
jgi:two-component system chemotaxis response regulator CheB